MLFVIGYSVDIGLKFINLFLKRVLLIISLCILLFMNEAWFARTYLIFIGACFWSMLSTVPLNVPNEIWEKLGKTLSNSCIKASLEKSLYFLYWMIVGCCLVRTPSWPLDSFYETQFRLPQPFNSDSRTVNDYSEVYLRPCQRSTVELKAIKHFGQKAPS